MPSKWSYVSYAGFPVYIGHFDQSVGVALFRFRTFRIVVCRVAVSVAVAGSIGMV